MLTSQGTSRIENASEIKSLAMVSAAVLHGNSPNADSPIDDRISNAKYIRIRLGRPILVGVLTNQFCPLNVALRRYRSTEDGHGALKSIEVGPRLAPRYQFGGFMKYLLLVLTMLLGFAPSSYAVHETYSLQLGKKVYVNGQLERACYVSSGIDLGDVGHFLEIKVARDEVYHVWHAPQYFNKVYEKTADFMAMLEDVKTEPTCQNCTMYFYHWQLNEPLQVKNTYVTREYVPQYALDYFNTIPCDPGAEELKKLEE
jgi:hypothetical protein